jgi:2-polyprenyl-6-methoxyphenol hydroxylase-like FAD-dependent oxidoreductase
MRILIAGGGIGGLTLALTLHRAGLEPAIFEQAPSAREAGVGVNILPHAVERLSALGLLSGLRDAGIETRELIYKTARGQEILRQPRGLRAGLDAPQISIHRGKLHGLLRAAVLARLGADALRMDRRLTGFSQDDGGVRADFVDGAGGAHRARGDVLVGADGIHSTVRGHFAPEEGPPRWNGVLMFRGATDWPAFLTGASMIIAGGMAAKLVLYPIHRGPARADRLLTNWVICARTGAPGDPPPLRDDWSKPATPEDALAHVEGRIAIDEIDLPALIRATREIFVYPMCDRDPLPRWTDGRVTLLGDAAHPMYPVGSNGASQAILDAEALTQALVAEGAAGMAAYDAQRRPATAAIVTANRHGGPERVIDLVEDRAPDGFDRVEDVAAPDELTAIVGAYQSMTATPAQAAAGSRRG